MEVANDWAEKLIKDLVSFHVSCVDADGVFLVLVTALEAELDLAASVGGALLHIRPDFSREVFL